MNVAKASDVPAELLSRLTTKPVEVLASPADVHSRGSSGASDRSEILPTQGEQLAEARSQLSWASDHIVAERSHSRQLERQDRQLKEFMNRERVTAAETLKKTEEAAAAALKKTEEAAAAALKKTEDALKASLEANKVLEQQLRDAAVEAAAAKAALEAKRRCVIV